MLHLHELRVLRCVVCLGRQRGCGQIGLSLRPLFPPLDATCPTRAEVMAGACNEMRGVNYRQMVSKAVHKDLVPVRWNDVR